MNKTIPIGADHAGVQLKKKVIDLLENKGFEVKDFGCHSDASIDYPDYGHPVASMVEQNEGMFGVVICGSGNGINMTTNKHQGVRSALCWNTELAALARQHNNANILALPARFVKEEDALEMVNVFISTNFEGGRHERRVDKIPCS